MNRTEETGFQHTTGQYYLSTRFPSIILVAATSFQCFLTELKGRLEILLVHYISSHNEICFYND